MFLSTSIVARKQALGEMTPAARYGDSLEVPFSEHRLRPMPYRFSLESFESGATCLWPSSEARSSNALSPPFPRTKFDRTFRAEWDPAGQSFRMYSASLHS